MNRLKRYYLALMAVVLAACDQSATDGKRFIGVWESAGDPLRSLEVIQNGDNYLVTVLKGVPGPAPDMAPEIDTVGIHPAVFKNGMLEIASAIGATKVDVIQGSDELVFGGERFRRGKGPRRCSSEDPQCKTLFDLYRMNPQFRDHFHAALKRAHIVAPEWVPFGVTEPFTRAIVNGQQYIFSWIGEPHAVFHAFYIGYNESRGHVFGVYADGEGERIAFGEKDEVDICAHFDPRNCAN